MINHPIISIDKMIIICVILLVVILFRLKNFRKKIVDIIIVILLFVINLRIMIPSDESIVMNNNFDVLIVVDNTISMNAEDYNGNNTRLSAVKNDCKYIVEKLNGSRFSIITFNNISRRIIPYTSDIDLVIDAIDSITAINSAYASGSSLNTPYEAIIASLESSMNNEERKRFIFFVSDGEITDDSTLDSYKKVSGYVDDGAVLGYGTSKGGKMKTYRFDQSSIDEYIYINIDGKSEYGISKIDEDNLKKIANDIDVEYINMKNTSNVDAKLDEMLQSLIVTPEEADLDWYDDTYHYLMLPLVLMFILKFYMTRKGF